MENIADIKSITKIIYIQYLPLTKYNNKILYIPDFSDAGFKVEYWDITALFSKIVLSDSIDRSYIHCITSYSELVGFIRNIDRSEVLFIVQIGLEFRTIRLYRILTTFNCIIGQFDRPGFPVTRKSLSFMNIFRKLIAIKKYPDYIGSIILSCLKRMSYLKKFDIIFAAGTDAINRNHKSLRVLPVNHFDFDNFLENGASVPNVIDGAYCVFLDEYLPFHPDYKVLGIPTLDPNKYFSEMNSLFDRIESMLGFSVVIACHPKSDYSENPYNGRLLLKYKTLELVKYSQLVIVHASTSTSYAVIYNKPLLFTYTDHIKTFYYNRMFSLMEKMSMHLGAPLLCTKEELPAKEELIQELDHIKYEHFKNQYLTTQGSNMNLTPQIIINYLNSKN